MPGQAVPAKHTAPIKVRSERAAVRGPHVHGVMYTVHMNVNATEFRKDLFKLLERALGGEAVEVAYKGATVRVAASSGQSKLARARRQHALISDPDAIVGSDRKLMAKLEAEWRKEWGKL